MANDSWWSLAVAHERQPPGRPTGGQLSGRETAGFVVAGRSQAGIEQAGLDVTNQTMRRACRSALGRAAAKALPQRAGHDISRHECRWLEAPLASSAAH
jgi:hypothetical protein